MQGALYYPFIGVPDTAWWTRVMLYWDSVATIVPRAYVNNPARHLPYTLALIQNGLLHQVLPEESGHGLGLNFGKYLDRLSSGEIDRRRAEYAKGNAARIHRDKWLTYSAGLVEVEHLGLANGLRDPEEWIWIEATTAAEFMAALALSLCESGGRREGWRSQEMNSCETWIPTTDSPPAVSALLAGLVPVRDQNEAGPAVRLRVRGELQVAEVRSRLLERLLPVPEGQLPVEEILRFRRKHGGALPELRRFLEAKIDEAMSIPDPVFRARFMDRIDDEVNQRTEEAVRYLRSSGVRRISQSSLLRVLKFIPGLKDPIETAQELAQNLRRDAALETAPLAYLAFARATFAREQEYRVDPMTGRPLLESIL
jgi:hypothetical protein